MNIKVFWKSKHNDAYDAKGVFDGKGLTVLAGSKVNPMLTSTRHVRDMYDGYIDSNCALTKDIYFKSPSTAATFVSGRSANGWVEWKDENGAVLQNYRDGKAQKMRILEKSKETYSTSETKEDKAIVKRAKTPEEKLVKKIKRSYDKVKYIGDIPIDDQEYDILIDILKNRVATMDSSFGYKDDPIFTVALVQIGIRCYDGNFWSHVKEILGTKIDSKKDKIGSRFYHTLIAHNKNHLDENEIVNNILMHCFITKYYASDFFEFLFAYYQYDLDRDLEQHKEMRDHLMSCMKKAENSPRAFRIKKGTADAATVNEKGCKIRVYNILKWIDAYLFEDRLPEDSTNRTAQFFVEWAKTSKRFSKEKGAYYSRGKKHFRSPYLNFDLNKEEFKLILPVQTVPLLDDEETAELSWKVYYRDIVVNIDSETENTVIGCRNIETEVLGINPQDIFYGFKIELIKNGTEVIKRFPIKADSARFFDTDYDNISDAHLPEGVVYMFVRRDEKVESDAYYEVENLLNLDYYCFNLVKGNIVKKPDGKVLYVGKELHEGLREHYYIPNAKVMNSNSEIDIYSKTPSVLIKIKKTAQTGTLIIVNGKKNRFEMDDCIDFSQDSTEYNYYLINLARYCDGDNIYTVDIDAPSDRKLRRYKFALIENFNYNFEGAPYIFKDEGRILFNKELSVEFKNRKSNLFDFDIDSNTNTLGFNVNGFNVSIEVPVFKWKMDSNEEWCLYEPDELWHKELPDRIYFHLPCNGGCIYSKQDVMCEEDEQSIKLTADSENDCFVCDTRKIKTWLEMGEKLHELYVRFDKSDFKFITVITSCILTDCQLLSSVKDGQLEIKSTILGFSDCVVDVYNEKDNELIAEKLSLTSNGAKCKTDKLFGIFKLVFFEYDDEGDDFGDAVYSEFAIKRIELKNENSLMSKKIKVDYAAEDANTQSIFTARKYDIRDTLTVHIDKIDEENPMIYYGISTCSNMNLSNLKIEVDLLDTENPSKAIILFYDEEEMCFVDFVYDKKLRTILTQEDTSLSSNDALNRYIVISPPSYYHIKISDRFLGE